MCHNFSVPGGPDLTVYPTDRAPARAAIVLAHGAGAGQMSPFMVRAARALSTRGLAVATFDFPYMADRRRIPDRGPALEDAWRRAIAEARTLEPLAGVPLFIGGKSMGGRIASQVAAQGLDRVGGLIFLGYPLHPPGRASERRDLHLPAIQHPMLFVQGTRDTFGTADEIRELLPRLHSATTLHAVEGGDHSFKVPAKSGRSRDTVVEEIFDVVARWVADRANQS